jgi:hypothetical protein
LDSLSERDKRIFLNYLLPARFTEQHNGDYAFVIETFREYFAAVAIAATENPVEELKHSLHNPAWQQVLVYVADSLPRLRASRLDVAVPHLTSLAVKMSGPLVTVAAALLKHIAKAEPSEVGQPDLDDLAKWIGPYLQGPLERWLARSRRSTEFLCVSILRHGCKYESLLGRDLRLATRCLAAHSDLSSVKDRTGKLVNLLINKAVQSADGSLREQIFLDVLREVARNDYIRDLLVKSLSERSIRKRIAAVRALKGAKIQDQTADRLLEILEASDETDDSLTLQISAGESLRSVANEPRILERLLKLAVGDEFRRKRAAIAALGGAALHPRVKELLTNLMFAEHPAISMAARESLSLAAGKWPDWDASLNLNTNEYEPGNTEIKDALVSDRPWERLLDLTSGDLHAQRSRVIRALTNWTSIAGVRARLVELTSDAVESIREDAVRALRTNCIRT